MLEIFVSASVDHSEPWNSPDIKMFLKVIAIVAFIGICQSAPTDHHHAYSSQSIVVHHEHKEHKHEPEHHQVEEKKVEYYHQEEPKHESHEHKHVITHEHEVKHEVKHEEKYSHEHKNEHKSEHKQEHKYEHKPAISSTHIERHDIPAHPPKGFNDHHGHAKYEFSYKVHDPHTHDVKQQHETRDGHAVHGVYSLHEADGSVRTVHYSADKKKGFEAEVKHTTKHVEDHKHHH